MLAWIKGWNIYIYMNMWGLMHMIYGDTCVHYDEAI